MAWTAGILSSGVLGLDVAAAESSGSSSSGGRVALGAGKSENDMLQCFIESKYKDGRPTTEAEVTGLLIAALFAGQHTSSITSTWTGAYLLRHNEFPSAVVEEKKQLMQKHGSKVDHDILSEMDTLYRLYGAIVEELRAGACVTFPEIDWNAMVVGVKER
ncbi:hypothetical protein F3Y22_tig00111059pilonHSYRG00087 [Hibiscus syriacus]|uniref:Uncharacterized protein n=1 Tax=Hibiscus syriacus TaxID=106335 RepID=A0A6A2Z451_HIBSY|nr:hypothetical protein F3Y22_tig00111059pilonHSYRG00087 [Hibiscus syriacus]